MIVRTSRSSFSKPRLWLVAAAAGVPGILMAQTQDAAEDIRGPKPMVEIPQPEKFPVAWWAAAGASLILLGIVFLVWRLHLRRKRRKSPGQVALASLSNLEATRDSLDAGAFADQAALTVRQYIADRFGIAAPRRTTEEFFRELAREGVERAIAESDLLKAFLKSCDLAKFAEARLDSAQRGALLRTARNFVTATAPSGNHVKSTKA